MKLNKDGQLQFTGKLINLSEATLKNTNGKNYKVAEVEFTNAKGELVKRSAVVYEGNYGKGMTIGNEYLCTASQTEQGVIIQVSHLNGTADRPDTTDFDFAGAPVVAAKPASSKVDAAA